MGPGWPVGQHRSNISNLCGILTVMVLASAFRYNRAGLSGLHRASHTVTAPTTIPAMLLDTTKIYDSFFASGVVGCEDPTIHHRQPARLLQLLRRTVEVGSKHPRALKRANNPCRNLQLIKV